MSSTFRRIATEEAFSIPGIAARLREVARGPGRSLGNAAAPSCPFKSAARRPGSPRPFELFRIDCRRRAEVRSRNGETYEALKAEVQALGAQVEAAFPEGKVDLEIKDMFGGYRLPRDAALL